MKEPTDLWTTWKSMKHIPHNGWESDTCCFTWRIYTIGRIGEYIHRIRYHSTAYRPRVPLSHSKASNEFASSSIGCSCTPWLYHQVGWDRPLRCWPIHQECFRWQFVAHHGAPGVRLWPPVADRVRRLGGFLGLGCMLGLVVVPWTKRLTCVVALICCGSWGILQWHGQGHGAEGVR